MKKLLLIALFFLATPYAHAALNDARGYYSLDESSGNAADSSGNGYTMTNNGTMTYAAGKINNGAVISPTGPKYLSTTNILGTTSGGNITIAGCYKVATLPANNTVYYLTQVAAGATAPNISYGIEYSQTAGVVEVRLNISKMCVANSYVSNTTTLTVGTWYHIAVTYDGTNGQVYINGSSVAGPTAVSGNGTSCGSDGSQIGAGQGGTGTFDGMADEVGVWSRALSSTEISQLYNSGACLNPYATVIAINNIILSAILQLRFF